MKSVEERWNSGLPINLKDLSAVMYVSYRCAKRWASHDDFPRVGNFLMKPDFLRWWKKNACRASDCKSRDHKSMNDLTAATAATAAWPPRAARLRREIESGQLYKTPEAYGLGLVQFRENRNPP